jgi:hypothetical protein
MFENTDGQYPRQVNFQRDDDEVRFVLDQHAEMDYYSARLELTIYHTRDEHDNHYATHVIKMYRYSDSNKTEDIIKCA